MNFITRQSGSKIINVQLSDCSKKSICPAILNHLMKDIEGPRMLILDYISPNEVHYKTQIKSIFLYKPNALNCFHKGHIHVKQSTGKITIVYNLFNYYWFIVPSSSLLILFTLAMIFDHHKINVLIGFIFLASGVFPMAYVIFFVVPFLVWRHKLNLFDDASCLQKIIDNSKAI